MLRPLLASLALLVPLAHAQEAPEPADLIVFGKIFTSSEPPLIDGLAVRGNRIVAVGTREEIEPHRGSQTRVLDNGTDSVVPGFNDAHCHFTVTYALLGGVDLTAAHNLEEVLALVAAYADKHPDEPVIEGRGWDLADMEGFEFPTAADLDAVVPDRPVILSSEGPHGYWVNSAALARAGIDSETSFSPATIVIRDEEGSPAGIFLGRDLLGLFDFTSFSPPFSSAEIAAMKEALRAGLAEAASFGVTTVHESVPTLLLPFFAKLHDDGELTLRFHVWGSAAGGPQHHMRMAKEYGRREWITFGTLKIGLDGMPGLRTAHMLEPYADAPDTRGFSSIESAQLADMVKFANRWGVRVALHATGDASVRMSAKAFAPGNAAKGARNRIEHAFLVTPEDVKRSAAAGIVLSVQPGFLMQDLAKNRFYERFFGAERCATVLPLRSLIDAGVVVAFGTDFGLTPIDPMVGLFAATARQTRLGEPAEGWFPDERISLEEAVIAYTYGSAYAEGAEAYKGTIEPGKLADLVLLSGDIFASESQALLNTHVVTTIVDGKVVYER